MQTIYLDISNKGVSPIVYAKQGDVGRKFQVVLTDSGLPYIPTGGSAFSVWYSGASGDGNYTDIDDKSAFTVSENKVIVEMISQMLSSDGDGVLSLVLNDPNGNQISTWNIPYFCEPVPGAESEEAKNYYTAFSQAVENLPYPDTSLSVAGKAADSAAVGASLASKAPAGYGLGENAAACPNSDCNQAVNSGWYTVSGSNTVNGPGENGVMLVLRRNSSCIWQYHYSYNANPSVRRRMCISDFWYEWEWENPPMALGVEYRTTERDNGKVVYAKKIDFGALPNATYKYVNHGATLTKCTRYNLVNKHSSLMLTGHRSILVNVDENVVQMSTNADLSAHQAFCDIWYTKD